MRKRKTHDGLRQLLIKCKKRKGGERARKTERKKKESEKKRETTKLEA